MAADYHLLIGILFVAVLDSQPAKLLPVFHFFFLFFPDLRDVAIGIHSLFIPLLLWIIAYSLFGTVTNLLLFSTAVYCFQNTLVWLMFISITYHWYE